MKFETEKGVGSAREDQVKAKRGWMLAAKAVIKQFEVIILEVPE